MRVYTLLLAALVIALAVAPGWCYPNMNGPTGIVSTPSAGVVRSGAVDLAADYVNADDGGIIPTRFTLGWRGDIEFWGSYTVINDDAAPIVTDDGVAFLERAWNLGAKYRITTETENSPAIALGLQAGRLENDVGIDNYSVFAVASKSIRITRDGEQPFAMQGNLGLVWTNYDDPVDENLLKPFIGVELFGARGMSLGLEYRLKDDSVDSDAPFSAIFRYPLGGETEPFWVEIGTTNAAVGGIGGSDSDLFIGFGYRFTGLTEDTEPGAPGERTQPWGY